MGKQETFYSTLHEAMFSTYESKVTHQVAMKTHSISSVVQQAGRHPPRPIVEGSHLWDLIWPVIKKHSSELY